MRGGSLGVWPPLTPAVFARRPESRLPFPLGGSRTLLTSQGRQGLYLGLQELGVGTGDEVLVPAYHHGSEVEAIRRTGAETVFYGGDDRLRPEAEKLEALCSERTRALHLTHFVGFPQEARRWRQWCDERELLLIEDAAQGWLGTADGKPLGSYGDVAVFCLYKTVGVPDGAATTVCAARLPSLDAPRESGSTAAAKRLALWTAQRVPVPGALSGGGAGEAPRFDAEAEFDLGDPGRPQSVATSRLVARFDFKLAAARRRVNYRALLGSLRELVPPPFETLPVEAVPWFFPVRAADKAAALAHLMEHRVRALDFWSVGHPAFDAERFPKIAERRSTTIGLPVHQELTPADVTRIAEVAASAPGLDASQG